MKNSSSEYNGHASSADLSTALLLECISRGSELWTFSADVFSLILCAGMIYSSPFLVLWWWVSLILFRYFPSIYITSRIYRETVYDIQCSEFVYAAIQVASQSLDTFLLERQDSFEVDFCCTSTYRKAISYLGFR